MGKKTKILVIIISVIIIFVAIAFWYYYSVYYGRSGWAHDEPLNGDRQNISLEFEMDKGNRTLTLINGSTVNLNWSEFEINTSKGNAILPYGTVEIGDVITNCTGVVILKPIDSPIVIGIWNFD